MSDGYAFEAFLERYQDMVYATAVRLLGADPKTTVYVGDSIHDMLSGRAAGVRTAAALWGPFGRSHLEGASPDYWLDTPEDLVRLVLSRPGSPAPDGAD
jgi:phosphoglycolate phosphatase-like HAD superfamily hydrolase